MFTIWLQRYRDWKIRAFFLLKLEKQVFFFKAWNSCIVNIEINTWSLYFVNLQIDLNNFYYGKTFVLLSTMLCRIFQVKLLIKVFWMKENFSLFDIPYMVIVSVRGRGELQLRDWALILKIKVSTVDIGINQSGLYPTKKAKIIYIENCLVRHN